MITESNLPNLSARTFQLNIEQDIDTGNVVSRIPPDLNHIKEHIADIIKLYEYGNKLRLELNQMVKEAGISPRSGEWYGLTNKYYLGPDIHNSKIVLIVGQHVNGAISQMVTAGERSTTYKRKPTAKKQSATVRLEPRKSTVAKAITNQEPDQFGM